MRILGLSINLLLPAAVALLLSICSLAALERSANAALPSLELERVFPALTFERPVLLTHAGDGSSHVYVVEQHGVIHRIDPAAPERAEVFLDISPRVSRRGNEEGLLGLAFAGNGRFYAYYSAASPRRSVLSRFETGSDGLGAPASESVILQASQPYPNHNGGMIAFGPDGMLYVALGDGGSAGDPQRNGQDLATLLGAILRIDVTRAGDGAPYAAPDDNPFVGQSGARSEIWAYGLRNPWRFSFDKQTGDLWTGDVGQNALEEVNIVRRGGNYGWNVMEGSRCFSPPCNAGDFEPPLAEYGRDAGCSITGGYVYRGRRLPELHGAYLYADFCSGRIWGLRYDGERVTEQAQLARAGFQVPSFGEDGAGEVYVLGFDGGVYTFAAPPGAPPQSSPPTSTPTDREAPTPALFPTGFPTPAPTSTPATDAPATRPTPSPTDAPAARPTFAPATDTPATTPTPSPTDALAARPAPAPATDAPLPATSSGGGAWIVVAALAAAALAMGLVYAWRRLRSAKP